MSTFFEKNKRKSALALLLLFLRWRRGLGPLLLMVMLVMFVFIAPANLMGVMVDGISKLPGGARAAAGITWMAGRLGLWQGAGDTSFEDLMAAFKAARADRSAAAGLWRNILGPGGGTAGSSIGLVRGSKADLDDGAAGLGSKVTGGSSIGGVMTPGEAREGAEGVEIRDGDLAGERAGAVQSAFAGGAGGSGLTGRMGAGLPDASGSGAYAGSNFFSGANTSASFDRVQSALNSGTAGQAATPKVSAQDGRIQRNPNRSADTRSGFGANRNPIRRGVRALAQLADGRSRTQMARDPYCTVSNGCMPEYASTNAGAIYDGNAVGVAAGGILTSGAAAPQVDGITVPNPNVPSDGNLGALDEEARKLAEDAAACDAARAKYADQKAAKMQRIQTLSDEMNSMDCGGGGCDSKSKAKKCKAKGNQMKAACRDLDLVMEAEYNECPLMQQDGPYQHQSCN